MRRNDIDESALIEWSKDFEDLMLVRKFEKQSTYHEDDGSEKKIGVFLDVETTGKNKLTDEIVQLGMVALEFSPESGKVFRVLGEYDKLEEPHVEFTDEASAINGLTMEDVKGCKMIDSEVENFIKDAVIILAHNASFDRCFIEKRFPFFEGKCWGCSMVDVDWGLNGFDCRALKALAYEYGYFYTAHRAVNDCYASINLLTKELPVSGGFVLTNLLTNARESAHRVYAWKSHISTKDILKGKGYRWNANFDYGDGGKHKGVWSIDVNKNCSAKEVEWLKNTLGLNAKVCSVNAYSRHSGRM